MSRSYSRANIISRLFNQPLAVTAQTASIVLGAIGERLDVSQLFVPTDGRAFALSELEEMAATERVKIESRGFTDRQAKNYRAQQLMLVHAGVAHVGVRDFSCRIVAQVQRADAGPDVMGILLDIDSPGGEVAGLYECANILLARRGTKPMRAMIRGMGCSAAYALAATADEVTLHDLGYAGSIGTIAMHADYSAALEQDGVKVTLFKAGDHKADGNPFEALPENVAREIQTMVDIANSRFIAHVASARGISEDNVRAQQAQIYRGEAAVSAGLVDRIMSWQDSMDEFEQQVNSPGASPPGGIAPSGASSAKKGTAMSTEANAPAANTQQPEITNEAAIAGASTEAAAAATETERSRVSALVEIDAASSISPALSAAIADGSSAGDFAIAQAKAGKAKLAAAGSAAKSEAIAPGQLPEGSASAADPAKPAETNRGKSYASKKQAAAS